MQVQWLKRHYICAVKALRESSGFTLMSHSLTMRGNQYLYRIIYAEFNTLN